MAKARRDKARDDAQAQQARKRGPHFDFAAIEPKWRERWETKGTYHPDLKRAKRPYYNLMMFPYPSAAGLHIGNVYAFIGSDVHGRWMSARGEDVFEPMGFDAFGIHSENFAIKQGVHPAALTAKNVAHFRDQQLKRIGNRFDWSAEVDTTDPAYYRWTQWIFVKLFKAGLAERRSAAVNWCPNDKTVLADEQVIDGHCERCGALVERRQLDQWFLKITDYAERLLANLDSLDWSNRVKAAQRNWIGRSEGLEFSLAVAGHDAEVRVFTTRPDTIYGVTFVVLAPDHPLVDRITAEAQRDAVTGVRAAAEPVEPDATPTAGAFTGTYAIHPLTGKRVPIWVADYVLMGYGTGAIMAVPAHDTRDLAFARAHHLGVRQVVVPDGEAVPADEAWTGAGTLVSSGEYSGLGSDEAAERIITRLEEAGIGKRKVHYHLRDWLISRQRYWGPPVPIIYCPDHGAVPVPEEDLPVRLPDLEDYLPTSTGDSPLSKIPGFVATTCPICGKPAGRETDVMDNFLDSAWYFLRYPSSHDSEQAWDPETTRHWLPVKMYIGGAEHSVLHLMYARFITMAMHDLGHLDFDEPFTHFRAHGIITINGDKISKSKGNIINPDDYLDDYGADTLRAYLMFMGPYEAGGDFSDRGIGGVVRFMDRVWRLCQPQRIVTAKPDRDARRQMHETIGRVDTDIGELKYNTAIATLMGWTNTLDARKSVTADEVRTLLTLLSPFAPFVTCELWERASFPGMAVTAPWPQVDSAALARDVVTLIVQVDGRMRDRVEAPSAATEAEARAIALGSAKVRAAVGQRTVRDAKYIVGRLINLVTEE
ncbi:MAG TPA: leucine--tRNA ligase [Ktedonobacterales bacterium]